MIIPSTICFRKLQSVPSNMFILNQIFDTFLRPNTIMLNKENVDIIKDVFMKKN